MTGYNMQGWATTLLGNTEIKKNTATPLGKKHEVNDLV